MYILYLHFVHIHERENALHKTEYVTEEYIAIVVVYSYSSYSIVIIATVYIVYIVNI